MPIQNNVGQCRRDQGAFAKDDKDDPYLSGFLAGYAAAKANANTNSKANTNKDSSGANMSCAPSGLNASLPLSNNLTPHLIFRPLIVSAPPSHDLFEDFPQDHELHEWTPIQHNGPPRITRYDGDEPLLNFNSSMLTSCPPALSNYGWIDPSDQGAISSLASQPSLLVEGDVPFDWHVTSDLAGSQQNGLALSEPHSLLSGLDESHNISSPGPAGYRDQPLNADNTHISNFIGVDGFIQTDDYLGVSTRTTQEANLDKQVLFPKSSPPRGVRRSQDPKSSVPSVRTLLGHLLGFYLHQF